MSRRIKSRRVCKLPEVKEFVPVTAGEEKLPVILTVDEYEAVRLIDKDGFSQEACSMYMHVARTTVQRIYSSARKKMADSLVEGRPLRIEGGDFWLCGEDDPLHSDL